MSLAVATTKQGEFFSCIQVRMAPKTRVLVPASCPPCASDFSISSSHNTHGRHGARDLQCTARPFFRFADQAAEERADIERSKGKRHSPAIILAVKLLPVPGMPISARPWAAAGRNRGPPG